MQKTDFILTCPFKLEDKVKIILLDEPLTLSESNYTVSDILVTHSIKTGDIVKFKIVIKDEKGRDLSPKALNSIKLIDENLGSKDIRISNEKECGLRISDTICKKCGGIVKKDRENLNTDEDGEGGYWVDIFTCTRCKDKDVCPD